jgi:secreted PhoX family phosphatase
MTWTRRAFLTYLGVGSYSALTACRVATANIPTSGRRSNPPTWFQPIGPSRADELIVPKGFRVDRIMSWGDDLGSVAPDGTPEKFGFNNDFIAYFPIDALQGGSNSTEGLLWVNHEYPNPLFQSGYTPADYRSGKKKTADQIMAEKLAVGGSVVHVRLGSDGWKPVVPSRFNRRITAAYPEIAFSGPAAAQLVSAIGSLANCSGGRTPWFTALSCEENFLDYNGTDPADFKARWSDVPGMAIDETRYGWVLEVDPFGELPPIKHTALGRFKHENCAVTRGAKGQIVIYMGDDEADQHLYKFVSAQPDNTKASRAERRKLLEQGTLYAADLSKGRWIPLIYNPKSKEIIEKSSAFAAIKKANPNFQIRNQAELLIHTRIAARALGATPLDRCEDCEVHPLDGSVYVAMTNNTRHGNLYGHIVRLLEDGDDAAAESFRYEIFLAGGPQSGLACPDNLAFDRHGNLWVVCDMSTEKVGEGAYKPFGNNGVYVVPTVGPGAGDAFQFASGPVDSELTGPWFTEDGKTLFLAVQHPGETSPSLDQLTSHWPDGGTSIPKPSIVAIRGFA